MLKFVSSYLALSYLTFVAIAVAGLLQTLAAWHPFVGLALVDYRQPSLWKRALGPALIVIAYAWFFGTRREILTPGPAGAELTLLFGGAVLLALALTIAGASILRPYRQRQAGPASIAARPVTLDHGQQGWLYSRGEAGAQLPGVCLVPDPASPPAGQQALAAALIQAGMVVLVPVWDADRQRYPDALSLVPLAMEYLSRCPQVDSQRLAVVGVGLGADLALRAAAADREVRAVAALGPLLQARYARPGLGLLREMTYPEALAWGLGGRRSPLVAELDAPSAVTQLARQPALVLYGSHDALIAPDRAQEILRAGQIVVRTVPGETHVSLASSARAATTVAQWLMETLHET